MANGAQLVKIESNNENDFIEKELQINKAYWIGLTDAETENEWKWSDGSQLTEYTNWKSGQPNNHNGKDCVAVRIANETNYNGRWYSAKCSSTKRFICEV